MAMVVLTAQFVVCSGTLFSTDQVHQLFFQSRRRSTQKSDALRKVDLGSCVICGSGEITGAHVVSNEDVHQCEALWGLLPHWMDQSVWRRPFDAQDTMNLVPLCVVHHVDFDHHLFTIMYDFKQSSFLVYSTDDAYQDVNGIEVHHPNLSKRAVAWRLLQYHRARGEGVDDDAFTTVCRMSAAVSTECDESGADVDSADDQLDTLERAGRVTTWFARGGISLRSGSRHSGFGRDYTNRSRPGRATGRWVGDHANSTPRLRTARRSRRY